MFSKFIITIVLNLNWCFRQSSLALWIVIVYSIQTVVCVYVCVYMCVYMYSVFVYMCVYMCVCVCICMWCVCVYVCVCDVFVQGKASVKS